MAVLSELRYPTSLLIKILTRAFSLVLLFVLLAVSIAAYLVYQVVDPLRTPSKVDFSVLLGHPEDVAFALPDGSRRHGWFFPGLRGAPTILVCHGYESQSTEALPIVTALQESHYNVFLFDFSGHGSSSGITTLGYRESGDVRAAIRALAARDDVDHERFGAWGADMGAYSILSIAETDSRIAAIALDSVYDSPPEFFHEQVRRSGLSVFPLVTRIADFGFWLMNYKDRGVRPLSTNLVRLAGVPKLFIFTHSVPELADSTDRIYQVAPLPRQAISERAPYSEMTDEERQEYENVLVNFFVQNLSPAPRH
ncbi:MAG: alpha/beta hydrolase [Candidatus Acidiferrales bacterium]